MNSIVREVPIDHIEKDADQPRKVMGTVAEQNRLYVSIKEIGIQQPLVVSEIEPNRYRILDGHRRFECAKTAGLKSVLCRVYEKLDPGHFELIRYEIQNNRRPWNPLEKSNALTKIKTTMGFKNDAELAEHLHLSPSSIGYSLAIRDQKLEYVELMVRYELKDSYQTEFFKLKPKIREIREFDVQQIIEIIFKKIQHDVITNAQKLRVLKRIFLRTKTNEEQLYQFLSNADMTIEQLELCTERSPLSLLYEEIAEEVEKNKKDGAYYLTESDQGVIKKFKELFDGIVF